MAEQREAQKDAYKQKLDAKLKEFDAEIDKMAAKAEAAEAEARVKFRDQIASLRAQRDEINDKIMKLNEANAGAFREMQKGIERAWDEFTDAIKAARAKFK